jgi:hypothetical protein
MPQGDALAGWVDCHQPHVIVWSGSSESVRRIFSVWWIRIASWVRVVSSTIRICCIASPPYRSSAVDGGGEGARGGSPELSTAGGHLLFTTPADTSSAVPREACETRQRAESSTSSHRSGP